MTKAQRGGIVLAALALGWTGVARAQTATQDVQITVAAINEIAVGDAQVSITIDNATAGSQPQAQEATSTYAITTNESDQVIHVKLVNPSLPSGLTLEIELVAPQGASSNGKLALTSTDQIAVSGITRVAASGLGITYTATADVSVTPGNYPAVVQLTIL